MPQLPDAWSAVLLVVVATTVLAGLWLRYRALERAGTPLPPGAGGARLIGATGTVVAAHDPAGARGLVRVLGDDWGVADEVTSSLAVGDTVRVVEVTGTRLVVEPSERDLAPPTATADPSDVRTP